MILPALFFFFFFSRLLWQFSVFVVSYTFQDYLFQFYIKSVDYFGQYGYFNNINSSNLRRHYIFPFLCSISSFPHQFLQFSVLCFIVFPSLVKFIPKYYILFFLLVLNRIVFLLSLSYSSSLMYRKATDLCVSILYPEILQVLLMFFITRFKWRLSHVAQEPEGLRYHFRIIYCIW